MQRYRKAMIGVIAAGIMIATTLAYLFYRASNRAAAPLVNPEFTRITSSGDVRVADISIRRPSSLKRILGAAQPLAFVACGREAGFYPLRDTRIPAWPAYQFVIHDRDTIFSSELDEEVKSTFGLKVLRTPVRAPQANASCERLMGRVRRECLDFIIPLNARQLRATLRSWVAHYNTGRPHSSLGPGIPGAYANETSSAAAPETSTASRLSGQSSGHFGRITSRILAGKLPCMMLHEVSSEHNRAGATGAFVPSA